jgi:hypothetical protein
MATERQIAANKLNAQKSTGPKTEAGKAKSCLNRFSHGFASSTAQLIQGEDPEELKALLADLPPEYQPATPTEQILVEKMCQNQWLSLRAFRLQSDCLTMRIQRLVTIPRDLGLFIRYQSAAERNFHQAHADLVKAQKERKKSEIGFESQDAAEPADRPSEKQTNEPVSIELNQVAPDFPAESPSPLAPEAQPAEAFIKSAA